MRHWNLRKALCSRPLLPQRRIRSTATHRAGVIRPAHGAVQAERYDYFKAARLRADAPNLNSGVPSRLVNAVACSSRLRLLRVPLFGYQPLL